MEEREYGVEPTEMEGKSTDSTEMEGGEANESLQTGGTLLDGGDTLTAEGTRPDWLKAELWDDETNSPKAEAVLDALRSEQERVKGLRQKLSRGEHRPPEDAKDYKLPELGEDSPVEIPDDDPFLEKFREGAKDAGLSQAAFEKVVATAIDYLKEHGAGETESETEEAQEAKRSEEMEKLGESAPRIIRAVSEWLAGQQRAGVFSEGDVEYVKQIGSTADGVKFLNKVRTLTGGGSIPVVLEGDAGLPSDAEIAQHMKSPAYRNGDTSAVAKVEKWLSQRERAGRSEYLQFDH